VPDFRAGNRAGSVSYVTLRSRYRVPRPEPGTQSWIPGPIEEACESDPQAKEKAGDLYASWKAWADRSGEFAASMKMFSQKLIDRDYGQWRTGSARGFVGLRIVPVDSILHWSGRSDGCDR